MKKAIAAALVIGASALYIVTRTPAAGATTAMSADTSAVATAPAAPSGNVPPPQETPGPMEPAPVAASQPSAPALKDGVYLGSSVNAFYGYVQVKATVSGGKLTDVAFVSYPNDRDTSRYINSQAMPMLTREAISVQSANVDFISGATQTSQAFRQSLSAALASAANS